MGPTPRPEYPPDPIIGQAASVPVGAFSQWNGLMWVQPIVPGYEPYPVTDAADPQE